MVSAPVIPHTRQRPPPGVAQTALTPPTQGPSQTPYPSKSSPRQHGGPSSTRAQTSVSHSSAHNRIPNRQEAAPAQPSPASQPKLSLSLRARPLAIPSHSPSLTCFILPAPDTDHLLQATPTSIRHDRAMASRKMSFPSHSSRAASAQKPQLTSRYVLNGAKLLRQSEGDRHS